MKSTPAAIAAVMIKEAKRSRGGEPAFRIAFGWKFGLSYGPTPLPDKEVVDRFKGPIGQRMGEPSFATATYEQIADAQKVGDALGLIDHQWVFSASLHPRGRASVDDDWRLLGQMVAAVGAPEGSCRTPMLTTDPNDVHYWIWTDPEAPKPS
jgi:hypothetical protein